VQSRERRYRFQSVLTLNFLAPIYIGWDGMEELAWAISRTKDNYLPAYSHRITHELLSYFRRKLGSRQAIYAEKM